MLSAATSTGGLRWLKESGQTYKPTHEHSIGRRLMYCTTAFGHLRLNYADTGSRA